MKYICVANVSNQPSYYETRIYIFVIPSRTFY